MQTFSLLPLAILLLQTHHHGCWAFLQQPPPTPTPSRSHHHRRRPLPPLKVAAVSDLVDSIPDSGYQLGTVYDSATAMDAMDPMIVGAGAVAILALWALQFMQQQQQDDDEMKEPSTKEAAPLTTNTEPKLGSILSVTNEPSSSPLSATNPSNQEDHSELEPIMGNDDLNEEQLLQDKAIEAFQSSGSSGGAAEGTLRGSLSKLVGLVRSARTSAIQEKQLRTEAERKVTVITEELLDLEDKYELDQTLLQKTSQTLERTQLALESTQNDVQTTRAILKSTQTNLTQTCESLATTQNDLKQTSESLANLQEERRSLRKLGRVAWQLSKERVQTRIQNVKDRVKK